MFFLKKKWPSAALEAKKRKKKSIEPDRNGHFTDEISQQLERCEKQKKRKKSETMAADRNRYSNNNGNNNNNQR